MLVVVVVIIIIIIAVVVVIAHLSTQYLVTLPAWVVSSGRKS